MSVNGSYILDTNIIILLLNRDSSLAERAAAADEILLPIVAVGELLFGAAKSARAAENLQLIQDLAAQNSILICDFAVARVYGDLKYKLKVMGRPIPENDLWIAAIAVRWNLPLVTRDDHFSYVQGLTTEAW